MGGRYDRAVVQEPMVRAPRQRGQRHVQGGRQAGVPRVGNQVAQQARAGVGRRRLRDPAIRRGEVQPVQEEIGAFEQEAGVGQGLGIQDGVDIAGLHRADSVWHDDLHTHGFGAF
ncbi:hypothetical protein D3C72_1614270 [compost metagenome]